MKNTANKYIIKFKKRKKKVKLIFKLISISKKIIKLVGVILPIALAIKKAQKSNSAK